MMVPSRNPSYNEGRIGRECMVRGGRSREDATSRAHSGASLFHSHGNIADDQYDRPSIRLMVWLRGGSSGGCGRKSMHCSSQKH
jgi:hypothetical protein